MEFKAFFIIKKLKVWQYF